MTIDEYLESKRDKLYFVEVSFEESEPEFIRQDVKEMLRGFTEYHVNKALEKAANEVTAMLYVKNYAPVISKTILSNEGIIKVNEESILNCYKNEIK